MKKNCSQILKERVSKMPETKATENQFGKDYYLLMVTCEKFSTYEEAAKARENCENKYSDILLYYTNGISIKVG